MSSHVSCCFPAGGSSSEEGSDHISVSVRELAIGGAFIAVLIVACIVGWGLAVALLLCHYQRYIHRIIVHSYSVFLHITKYSSTLYIGMDEVLAHYACTFEISDLHFHFQ